MHYTEATDYAKILFGWVKQRFSWRLNKNTSDAKESIADKKAYSIYNKYKFSL